jgi:hypothetical protein
MTEDATLAEIRAQAVELMTEHQLYGWSFRFDNAKRRAGETTVWRDGRPGMITLSAPLMSLWTPEQRRDVILHEIAHALRGASGGHDARWRAICHRIGADPAREYETAEHASLPFPWTGTCPNGHKHGRDRLPRGRDPRRSCTQCSDRFDTRYLITWERTP